MLRESSHDDILRLRLSRTLLGRPLYWVSAYLIDGLLIDTGPPGTARELATWCASRRIDRVVNTHHHEDHIGANRLLAQELGLPILAPAASLPILAQWRRIPVYRRIVWGQPEDSTAEPLGELVETERCRLRVVSTPGHAFDHVCLLDEQRGRLFSGDLFVHEKVRYLRRIEDPWQHLASLRRVLALEPELLICSHAGLVTEARRALERKIAYWEELAERAGALRARGWSARRITRRLLGREGAMTYVSLGDFSKANLIRALLEGGSRGR